MNASLEALLLSLGAMVCTTTLRHSPSQLEARPQIQRFAIRQAGLDRG